MRVRSESCQLTTTENDDQKNKEVKMDMQRSSLSFQLYNNNKNVQFVCWFFLSDCLFCARCTTAANKTKKKTKMKTEKIVMLMIDRKFFLRKSE